MKTTYKIVTMALLLMMSTTLFVIVGANGTIFEDGFESGDLSEWTTNTATSGVNLDIVDDPVHSGTYALEVDTNGCGGTQCGRVTETISENQVHVKVWVYVITDALNVNCNQAHFILLRHGSNDLAAAGWKMD